ncbi:hypothetical protein ABPG75_006030 [Micractinium tetrahymenae]
MARRQPELGLIDLPSPALELIVEDLNDAERVTLASCCRELRRLIEGHSPPLWTSVHLVLCDERLRYERLIPLHGSDSESEEPPFASLLPWLAARRGVLQDLWLELFWSYGDMPVRLHAAGSGNEFSMLEWAAEQVALACAGGALTSLRLSLAIPGDVPDVDMLALESDALGELPHLQRLALHSAHDVYLPENYISLYALTALTALVLDLACMDSSVDLSFPTSLRHLAMPFHCGLLDTYWRLELRSACGVASLHVDVVLEDDRGWAPPSEEEAQAHSMLFASLCEILPRLQALSIYLPAEDPADGFPVNLTDILHLTALRALAVVHLPPAQAAVLPSLPALTRLHLTSSVEHPLQQLPTGLTALSVLRQLEVEGAQDVGSLAPLLPLGQLSMLALPACCLGEQAVRQLPSLAALKNLHLAHAHLPPAVPLLSAGLQLSCLALDAELAAAVSPQLAALGSTLQRLDLHLSEQPLPTPKPMLLPPDHRSLPPHLAEPVPAAQLHPRAPSMLRQVVEAAAAGLPRLRQVRLVFPRGTDRADKLYCRHALAVLGCRAGGGSVEVGEGPMVPAVERLREGGLLAASE